MLMLGIFFTLRRGHIQTIPAALAKRQLRAHVKENLAEPFGYDKILQRTNLPSKLKNYILMRTQNNQRVLG